MTESLKVVSAFSFNAESLAMLQEAAQSDVICVTRTDEFLALLAEAEIVCAYRLPENWREAAPHLRWLQYAEAGVDALRPTGLLDVGSGVIVTTAAGTSAITISEYAFGNMLMFNWNWPRMVHLQDRHIWARSASWYNLGGRELADSTLGIVGLGNIGRRIAHLGRAFGMRVLGMRRTGSTEHEEEQDGTSSIDSDVDEYFAPEELHSLLGKSDYVVLSVPLTSETEKMIGEAELRAMRPNAFLLNIARGRIIDEQALIRALQDGWIAGAGLDVVEEEPLPADSPLYSMPNVILTPHIAGVSTHYDRRLAALFADNLRRYRAGQPLLNRYDPERGY